MIQRVGWVLACGLAGSAMAETTFSDQVRPILRGECMQCHNADKAKGGLDLTSYEALLRGGSSGEIVVPGDPDASRLYQVMAHLTQPFMPENASKRPEEELAIVKQWIADGLLKQSGDAAKKPAANRTVLQPVAATSERPAGPPPLPRNGWLEPFLRTPRPNAVIALAASPWAPLVAIGGHRQIALYSDESLDLVDVRAFDEGLPTTVGFSRNASVLLAAGGVGAKAGSVVLWNVADGERLAEVGDEFDTVLAADLSPDQRWVALGGTDKQVKVLEVNTGELVHTFRKHTDWILATAFSPDGVLLATGDRSGGLTVWEAESSQEFHDLRGHQDAITRVCWRGDSNILASGSEDGEIRLWDMHRGQSVKNWKAHEGGVLDIAFAKDGSLASVGRDGRARIWNAEGKQQREIAEFPDLPTRCAFSHDDARLLVGDWTGQVSLWLVADGSRLGRIDANPPRLAERVEVATHRREEATRAMAPLQEQEERATEAVATLGSELAELEARRAEAEARQVDLARQLETAKSEPEREQEAQQSVDALQAIERALAAAVEEQTRAEDALPAKRTELAEAQTRAAETAATLAQAQTVCDQSVAEQHRWSEAARLHAVRETGITGDGAFALEVQPILEKRCLRCHQFDKSKGSFRLDRPDLILKGGESGKPAIVPNDPEASELAFRITLPPDDIDIMPPEGDPLSPEQIDTIRAWIASGAAF